MDTGATNIGILENLIMTKNDLIKEANQFWPDSEKMVNAIFRAINTELVRKGTVRIYNFGTFKVVRSKVKEGQNFITGDRVKINRYKIRFFPCRTVERMIA